MKVAVGDHIPPFRMPEVTPERMKTVAAIIERADSIGIRRMAETLSNQLLEMMPELKGVAAWHAVGQRRTLDDYGRAVERTVSDSTFRPSS